MAFACREVSQSVLRRGAGQRSVGNAAQAHQSGFATAGVAIGPGRKGVTPRKRGVDMARDLSRGQDGAAPFWIRVLRPQGSEALRIWIVGRAFRAFATHFVTGAGTVPHYNGECPHCINGSPIKLDG